MRILVTRPAPQAGQTAARLQQRFGADAVVAPMLEIAHLPFDPIDPAGIAAVAVTSARAVEAVCARPEWAELSRLPVYCVGERSAASARAAGAGRAVAAEGTAEGLVRLIAAEAPQGTILYLAGQERSADLAGMLADAGISCRMVEVYGARPAGGLPPGIAADLQAGRIDWVLVYSRRSAETLARALARLDGLPPLRFACLSRNVAEPLRRFGAVHIAASPDEARLFALLDGP